MAQTMERSERQHQGLKRREQSGTGSLSPPGRPAPLPHVRDVGTSGPTLVWIFGTYISLEEIFSAEVKILELRALLLPSALVPAVPTSACVRLANTPEQQRKGH